MPDPFRRLRERASLLGNHHAKYIRHIEDWKDRLVELLESAGKSDQVHLWVPAMHPLREMMVIRNLGETPGEDENLLGCYYALQFLQLNLRLTDALRFELSAPRNASRVYKDFMIRSGLDFRSLTANYMHILLDLFIPEEQRPEFVVCGVGSRSDQDDIDVGVIDDGSLQREDFNRAIGKLSKEMLRRASFLHFYLSEHFPSQHYSATVAEYRQLLDQEGQDFILINEVIGAALILGSEPLLERFKNEVTWRYHFASDRNNKYHEAYLRGILGEVRSLLAREERQEIIHLKDDALRMLKAIIYVEKARFRIDKVNPWDILSALQLQNPSRREVYAAVEEALNFLEIFRHLYQLFVVQEEELKLGEIGDAGHVVAEYLGYRDAAAGWDRLVLHYREQVSKAKAYAEILLQDATLHLHRTSTLGALWKQPMTAAGESGKRNLVLDFARAARFFRGGRFWDDLLEDLEAEDRALLRRITEDFNQLRPHDQTRLARHFARAGRNSFYAMVSLLVVLAANARRCNCQRFFKVLNEAFLKVAQATDSAGARLARLFHRYPLLVHEYLTAVGEGGWVRFQQLVAESAQGSEDANSIEKLRYVCRLHSAISRYFHRHFTRAARSHPECLLFLSDTEKLDQVARGLLATADGSSSWQAKTRILGEYSDLQFLKVGLKTVAGCPVATTNAEFSEFSDTYLRRIFDASKQNIEEESHERLPTKDLLAVFTAGTRAREQAYDDDCDLIILLDSTDEKLRRCCSRIAQRMNSELLKRGSPPHYRFAEYFGHYVTTVEEISRLLAEPHPNDFIDKSQLLGSRMIIGSSRFARRFVSTVLQPHVFEKSGEYAAKMIAELEARHQHGSLNEEGTFDLKEGRGGLRDIEMILLVYAARHTLAGPANAKLIEALVHIEKDHAADFEQLAGAFEFLKSIRDVYRLVVSAEDTVQSRYLGRPAEILGFKGAAELCAAYREKTARASEIIDRLAARALG